VVKPVTDRDEVAVGMLRESEPFRLLVVLVNDQVVAARLWARWAEFGDQ